MELWRLKNKTVSGTNMNPDSKPTVFIPAHQKPDGIKQVLSFLAAKPFLTSFLFTLLTYLPIAALFKTYYEFPDDNLAALLFNGIALNSSPSEFNLAENAFLSIILKTLYIHWPGIQWYALFLVVSLLLSFWAVLSAFQLGSFSFFKTALFIFGSAVIAVHLFSELEWTQVSSLAAIGGFILLAALWQRADTKYLVPGLSLAFPLLMLSALIRFPNLLLITLVMAPAAIYLFPKAKNKSVRKAVITVLILAGLMSGASLWFQQSYYSKDPAWGASLRFLNLQRGLLDYRNPVYNETTKPVFDSIGWTANDLALAENSYFMDPDTFSLEKISKLNNYFSQFGFNKNSDSFQAMLSSPYTIVVLFFLLVLFFFLPQEAWGFMAASASWAMIVLVFCLWAFKIPGRINLPCLYLQNCLALLFVVPKISGWGNRLKIPTAFKLGTAALVLFLLYSTFAMNVPYSKNHFWVLREMELKDILMKLNPQDDQLFVTWGTVFPYQEIGAFDDHQFLQHFHMIPLTWFGRNPTTQTMMDRFGLKDFSRDIVDNPHVRLICAPNQFAVYQTHMMEKYNLKVIPQVLFTSNQFPVIEVKSVPQNQLKPE
jgi:hypothetical protein